jgi:hypothetical protein
MRAESDTLLSEGSAARRLLAAAARTGRIVVFCGIPGVGKSFLLREQLRLALSTGRRVSLLQWDVSRQAFETPAIRSRYPELQGSTHVMIRRAVGIWLRDAIVQWSDTHSDATDLLLIEAPLVGGRMSELAYQMEDRAEALLSGHSVHFYVPTPTREVRFAIEAVRRVETASHRHARDAANAVPALVDELWQMVAQTAERLHIHVASPLSGYSPEAYFAVYRAVLRHRPVTEVPVEEIVSGAGSPHALDESVEELVPASFDVAALIARAEAEGDESVAARAARWYET